MSVVEVTRENLKETIQKSPLVLLDFWAAWCGPCRNFSKVYEEVALAYPDFIFGTVDVEKEKELAADFGIRSIPYLVIFRGDIAVFKEAGAKSKDQLVELIEQAKNLDEQTLKAQLAQVQSDQS